MCKDGQGDPEVDPIRVIVAGLLQELTSRIQPLLGRECLGSQDSDLAGVGQVANRRIEQGLDLSPVPEILLEPEIPEDQQPGEDEAGIDRGLGDREVLAIFLDGVVDPPHVHEGCGQPGASGDGLAVIEREVEREGADGRR